MIPHDDFTPHGYLDNPYHCWKLNPSGVLRSLQPLGMGWHTPNLGSYVRNQFQYTAHLQLGLKIGKTILITPEDFKRHGSTIISHTHTKNRFSYTCTVPGYKLTLTATYFLITEHSLGCIVNLTTTTQEPLPVTCYLIHQHTHNPHTSRLWEHGLYAIDRSEEGLCMLGIASEGDVFVHGARSATPASVSFGSMGYVTALEDAAIWAHGIDVARPNITEHEESTGWQTRTVILPCHLTLDGSHESPSSHVLNLVLARGVSQDQSYQRWLDGVEEIALAEANHRTDDEQFWQAAPQLSGDWPAHWRRGFVYDHETLRMMMRPSIGVFSHVWDAMQLQAPRFVLAEAGMDVLFLSYADPALAAEVILGHFENALHPNLPCMREDGSYNMIADDGQICGTAPEWGYPLWCCDQLWLRSGDTHWLRRIYPPAAAYLRWWLDHRRDAEGWETYACSWESGQDVSSRFGPQQTGGTIIEHVRPVDLQASIAQSASILARWATHLSQHEIDTSELAAPLLDFAQEITFWQQIANEFTVKTRLMWQDGWFRDYDSVSQEWSTQQDTMHLAPVFCGVAGWGHIEQLLPVFSSPPNHSGWHPLSWPPVMMTLVGATDAADLPQEAADLAARFIDASYLSTDSHQIDEHGGLPGVTREYRRTITTGKWNATEYVNAGIEVYGWGALSIHLLIRYIMGLCEEEPGTITITPMLPQSLRQSNKTYTLSPVQWGEHTLSITCLVHDPEHYTISLSYHQRPPSDTQEQPEEQTLEWTGTWGQKRTITL